MSCLEYVFLAPGLKHCEVCNKLLIDSNIKSPIEKYIALIIQEKEEQGPVFFFCSIDCLKKFMEQILEELKKQKEMII